VVKPTKELEELWRRFKASGDRRLRNELIERYVPLVRDISNRIFSRLPRSVDVNDLRSAGIFGLIAAIEAYDMSRGIKFETYCSVRVRGSILDELRNLDWVPRLVRSKAQKMETAHRDLETSLGRRPRDDEIAAALDISMDELNTLTREVAATNMVSLSKRWDDDDEESSSRRYEVLADEAENDPIRLLQHKEIAELVDRDLSRKERLILVLYYYDELTMREIGRMLNLSESRVCQLHSRILDRLRERLQRMKSDLLA